MKEAKLASIISSEKENHILSLYGISIREIVSDVYKDMLNNSIFVMQMKQPLNSKSMLYDVYKDIVEDLIENLIDLYKDADCLLKYNIMVTDHSFYNEWRKGLFDILYEELTGK